MKLFDDFSQPNKQDAEERKKMLQLFQLQKTCKTNQPGFSKLMELQQRENPAEKYAQIIGKLNSKANSGKNYVVARFFNPDVGHEVSEHLKIEGYVIVRLPCETSDAVRYYIAHSMVDDRPILISSKQ